ncbi:uncharacterized protein LOC119310985 [Triticum dicoccoides]|uniref:uncharacterized protein LOC119310985 n=1 Tax=Triticum dicoccoides TaxID=85692 RepID=UPI00189167B6|nr:uncharacterized protein LOC119310985 [Triticum dicoccoides]
MALNHFVFNSTKHALSHYNQSIANLPRTNKTGRPHDLHLLLPHDLLLPRRSPPTASRRATGSRAPHRRLAPPEPREAPQVASPPPPRVAASPATGARPRRGSCPAAGRRLPSHRSRPAAPVELQNFFPVFHLGSNYGLRFVHSDAIAAPPLLASPPTSVIPRRHSQQAPGHGFFSAKYVYIENIYSTEIC